MTERNFWERFLDSLDTSGGHIAVLVALMGVGIIMQVFGLMKGEDIIVGSFGALLLTLKQVSSNMNRIDKYQETSKTVTTSEVIKEPPPELAKETPAKEENTP